MRNKDVCYPRQLSDRQVYLIRKLYDQAKRVYETERDRNVVKDQAYWMESYTVHPRVVALVEEFPKMNGRTLRDIGLRETRKEVPEISTVHPDERYPDICKVWKLEDTTVRLMRRIYRSGRQPGENVPLIVLRDMFPDMPQRTIQNVVTYKTRKDVLDFDQNLEIVEEIEEEVIA